MEARSNKIRCVFHDGRLDPAWQDSSTSRGISVPRTEISLAVHGKVDALKNLIALIDTSDDGLGRES